jgi:FAD/FMN-containing dehydrogenase
VFPESAKDVATAVRLAAERGQQIAPQATGHNAGPLGSLENAILLRTDRMRGVTIDAPARIARVEADVVWLEVVQAAARHGLAALAGTSPDVGVVGYTLGGGLSFLGRKYGLATNNLQVIELVTADGRLVRADRDSEPDLFWALRGGGGNFGVVTAIELRLFPVTEVYAGLLWYPIERQDEVLPAWRELTQADPPDELTTMGRFLNLPPIPKVPEPPAHAPGTARSPRSRRHTSCSRAASHRPRAHGSRAGASRSHQGSACALGSPHMYLNFAETRRDPASLWTDEAYHRLRRIKAAVDPGDLILSNQPVLPAR